MWDIQRAQGADEARTFVCLLCALLCVLMQGAICNGPRVHQHQIGSRRAPLVCISRSLLLLKVVPQCVQWTGYFVCNVCKVFRSLHSMIIEMTLVKCSVGWFTVLSLTYRASYMMPSLHLIGLFLSWEMWISNVLCLAMDGVVHDIRFVTQGSDWKHREWG